MRAPSTAARTGAATPAAATPGAKPAAKSTGAIDLSTRDLSLDLARVVCVLLVVVIHLLMVGVGRTPSGGLAISRTLEQQPWFDAATWVGQIMPLFFVVGGFASLTAWRSLERRGGSGPGYVRTRVLRLAQPALPLFVFYVVVLGGATLLGIDPALLATVAQGAGSPLWFLAAYALCQTAVPLMVRLHRRVPRATLVVLLIGAIAVDALRYGSGIPTVGLANLVFVWLLVQQTGFWYADGWFAARRWWQLAGIAALCYLALWPLTTVGPYDPNMLVDLNPPTLPLVLLGFGQACVLRLLRPALAALMRTRPAKGVVFVVGTRLMTIYLWHLPLIIAITGVTLLIPGASPEPATAAWWWSRPIMFVVVMLALFGLSFLVGRWEAPLEAGPPPPAAVVGVAALLTFLPAFLVIEWFLSLPLAALGAVTLTAAVLLLGRWPARWSGGSPAQPVTKSINSSTRPVRAGSRSR